MPEQLAQSTKMALLPMRLLLLTVALSVAPPGNALGPLHPPEAPASLRAALQAAGLERPQETLAVLRKLALPTVADLGLLDLEEGAEQRAERKAAEVALGDQARLRARLWQLDFQSSIHSNGRIEGVPRRLQQAESPEKAKDDAAISGDTIALMLTALLGIESFVIQARVSKAADVNRREIEQKQEQFGA
jgi:hypothetical protein